MRKTKYLFHIMLLIAALLFVACDDENDTSDDSTTTNSNQTERQVENTDTANDREEDAAPSNEGSIKEFLQLVNNSELPKTSGNDQLDYGLGYFLYYASIESTGLDNLIYNALVVHKQLEDGDISADSLTNGQQNLLDITDGIVFDPAVEITNQIVQTPEIRETILSRLTADQTGLSPEEALDSNQVSGIAALDYGADIGRKYLVYGQDSPDGEFKFLGVIIVVDASGEPGGGETYSFQGWDSLPLLGDASGPFWSKIPTGVSGDPENMDEGRPGVLLISESTYNEVK